MVIETSQKKGKINKKSELTKCNAFISGMRALFQRKIEPIPPVLFPCYCKKQTATRGST